MSEWKTYRLGDLIEVNKNSINKNFKYDVIEYLDTASVTENRFSDFQILSLNDAPSRAKRVLKENDIVYSTVRPILRHYGIVKNVKPNTIASTGFAVLTAKKIDPNFLFYYLTTDEIVYYLNSVAEANTTTYPAFNASLFDEIEVTIPKDINTQTQIAQILTSLDDKIELNLQMNQTLEAMAQAIFKEWFIDFTFPGFDGELVDGLPKGWRKEPLDEKISFLNGLALQKFPSKNATDFLPVIKIRELKQGISESSDKASTDIDKKYIIEDGDILFSWSGSLEVVMWCNGKGALNQHLFKVSSVKYPKWFYYYWTKEFLPIFQATASDKATTMGHIQRRHLTESLINVPDNDTLKVANYILEPLLERIKSNAIQIQTLIQTRDSLLPRLMSGKIKIENKK